MMLNYTQLRNLNNSLKGVNTMKKFYVGYHNKPWDMKDFTILCETENRFAATGIRDLYNKTNLLGESDLFVIYESRELPENAHY